MGRPLRGAESIEVGRGVFGRREAVGVLKTTFFGRSEVFGSFSSARLGEKRAFSTLWPAGFAQSSFGSDLFRYSF